MASSFPKSLDTLFGAGELISRRVGEITDAVYQLQLDGKVTTLEEAIAAARDLLSKV